MLFVYSVAMYVFFMSVFVFCLCFPEMISDEIDENRARAGDGKSLSSSSASAVFTVKIGPNPHGGKHMRKKIPSTALDLKMRSLPNFYYSFTC